MRLNAAEKNALMATKYLLWATKVNVSSKGLKEDFVMHPDFPSVASVSDALTEWHVPNMTVRLQPSQLKEIPLPSLVYLNVRAGILAPLKSVSNNTIEWLDTKNGWQKDSLKDFERKWDGVTILLEPNDKSGEEQYSEKSKGQFVEELRIPLVIGGAILCLFVILGLNWDILQNTAFFVSILFLIKTIGMVTSALLLWQSIDTNNPFLQNICQLGSYGNCNSVLQSKAAKVTSWISWAEIGFIYFTGGWFGFTIASIAENNYTITYLTLISFGAFPYTIYSIWYQYFIAKKWCTLCMVVQILLWIELAIAVIHIDELPWGWGAEPVLLFTLGFLIPTLLWAVVKKTITNASQLFGVTKELQKVKFNEDYIRSTFSNQPKMPPIFENMKTAPIGNHSAANVLTVVTNPLCGPCSQLHNEITYLLDSNRDFQCQFVFIGPPQAWQITYTFLNTSEIDRKNLMERWYNNKHQDIDKWAAALQIDVDLNHLNEQVTLHSRWAELAGVTGTPTTYLNGIKLTTAFKIRDLKRVISILNVNEKMSIIK